MNQLYKCINLYNWIVVHVSDTVLNFQKWEANCTLYSFRKIIYSYVICNN